MSKSEIKTPADVPASTQKIYQENYKKITKNTGKLFLFAGDQKIEHLNKDFYGDNIPKEVNNPEHLFAIASKGEVGAFATQMGLIAQYGKKHPDINYIIKLNSKTDIIPKHELDPISTQLWDISKVVEFKKNSGLSICGIGYTVYLGSEFESEMLSQASQLVYEAHQEGLVAILWMYPRGHHVKDEKNPDLLAGAAGVAVSLGADFAKINAPQNPKDLQQAVTAAGKTKLICSGGPKVDDTTFLQNLYNQIHIGGTFGAAIGRNIYQRKLEDAIQFTKKVSDIIYGLES